MNLGKPGKAEQRPVAPRRVLSLSGGGFRGLFTARVLERLEAEAGAPLRARFDLIGGTSIGGILAIGLAAGVPAKKLREEIEARGPAIFRGRRLSLGGFLSARYAAKPLREAIDAILGAQAQASFSTLPARVLVVAIDLKTARPKVFRSELLAPKEGDLTVVRDVALATSAAPTYFPPHRADGTLYVDGGLIANAPDLVLGTEAMRRFAVPLDSLAVCAVGTAGSPRVGSEIGAPGKLGWILRHELVPLTLDAQALLAADQLERLIPSGVLRIDAFPRTPIEMDDASPRTSALLLELADAAVDLALSKRGTTLRSLLAARKH